VPQRRGHPRRQLRLLDPDARPEPGTQDRRCLLADLGGARGDQPGDLGGDGDPPRLVGGAPDLLRRHPAEGGQIRPLVLVRFQRLQVQEDRRPVFPGGPEQRGGDQVADPADGQEILRGKSRS
jgi:hypothetical protein